MKNLRLHTKLSLGYFLLAASLGVLLRSFHSVEIPLNYKFIVHTHSHIALLGWVYIALTPILFKLFLSNHGLDKKYGTIFWFTQITLIGMLFTFPFQGYALFSIVFSTLFLFASYWFTLFFFKNVPINLKKTPSYKCVKVALWYLVISSFGPWALGAIMNTLGAESVWYRLAIYFYLHFLYNGWMIMALIGLFLYVLEQHQIYLPNKTFKRFFRGLNLGIILSFFLSALFANPPLIFNVLGGIGALFQVFAFGVLLTAFVGRKKELDSIFSLFQKGLLNIVIILFAVKMILQLLTSFPYFANLAATVSDFIIGYLHWTFLGVVSIALFLFQDYFRLIIIPRRAYSLYWTGFLTTEILIFYKGLARWRNFPIFEGFFELLALTSILIPLSLVIVLGANLLDKYQG